MGDPKKQRKKYDTPAHPWQADRIIAEKQLTREFGLKNKSEIWKMNSLLKRFKAQAKDIIRKTGEQAEKEKEQIIKKLAQMGLVAEGATIESILDLDVQSLLQRRLQTVVFQKGLAKSPKQARQFIVHGHVLIGEKKVNVPSYIVKKNEESLINFRPLSRLADEEHPERKKKEAKPVTAEKKETQKKEADKE